MTENLGGWHFLAINLYVNGNFKEYIDQITAVASANKVPLSTEICKAVKKYMQDLNDEKELVADNKSWDKFFKDADKDEMLKMSTLICSINNRIIRKLCQ